MNKEELETLKEIREYFNDIGLGEIYGNLGRMWAIVHNQLLNDNSKCYSIGEDCKRLVPQFNIQDEQLIQELGCCIDDMLKRKDLFDKLNDIILKNEKTI